MDVLDFFFMFLTEKNIQAIGKMVNEDCGPICKRDGEIYAKFDNICQNEFGNGIAPVNPMQQMMKNMFGGGKK